MERGSSGGEREEAGATTATVTTAAGADAKSARVS